jgi:ribosome-associated protein
LRRRAADFAPCRGAVRLRNREERTLSDSTDETIRGNVVACAKIADDKQADNVVVLDLRGISSVTDYFIIATGGNPRQLRAAAEETRRRMKAVGLRLLGMDGFEHAHWILLDYGDFVVHLFAPEYRELYDLDMLWGDAKRVDWR